MPGFAFVATSAALVVQAGEGFVVSRSQHSLSYRVVLSPNDEIRLATKEKFWDLRGVVTVKPAPATEASDKIIGAIYYVEASEVNGSAAESQPASYAVELEIPLPQFEVLISSACSGCVPESIDIVVLPDHGISYGWESDDRGKEWDNLNAPKVPVSEAIFNVPLVVPVERDDLNAKPLQDLAPQTRA